jgi:hypothetical protein
MNTTRQGTRNESRSITQLERAALAGAAASPGPRARAPVCPLRLPRDADLTRMTASPA